MNITLLFLSRLKDSERPEFLLYYFCDNRFYVQFLSCLDKSLIGRIRHSISKKEALQAFCNENKLSIINCCKECCFKRI